MEREPQEQSLLKKNLDMTPYHTVLGFNEC